MQCTGRRLYSIGIDFYTSLCRNHYGIDSGAFTRTGYRAKIPDIGNPVQQYDKRIPALLIYERNDILQSLISYSRHESNHSLMILPCYTVQALNRHTLDWNIRFFQWNYGKEEMVRDFTEHSYSMYLDRDTVIEKLQAQDIQTRPVWALIHEQADYPKNEAYALDKALDYRKHIVNLPCSTDLTEQDCARVIDAVLAL